MTHIYSTTDEIADVSIQRPHVVLLGAGASYAAAPGGDRNGRPLPLMDNFVDVVGLRDILQRHQLGNLVEQNFEDVYSSLYADQTKHAVLKEIESVVDSYFSNLALPENPTIYDYLVLSLRSKDVIATFNWDPFLYDACCRNYMITRPPRIIFLHGSVSIGYCETHRQKGNRNSICPICEQPFTASRLLYPISQKDYTIDPFIEAEWNGLRGALRKALYLTVFGYSAPTSDVEAIRLMKEAWGDIEDRSLEQTEIIDIRPKEELAENWEPFIHTHHYDVHKAFADSWLRHHPRRSCEAMWAQYFDVKFVEHNPMPLEVSFPSLLDWFRPLLDAEAKSGAG